MEGTDFSSTVVCRKTRDRRDYYLLLSQKTFFLLEHESEQAQEQTSATMLHDLKEFHRSADVRPGSAFSPHSNVCSLASATIHAAFETPRPPRALT